MIDEKRFAVLIDADNVSPRYIKYILDEMSDFGTATYKRIYGDWTNPKSSSWKDVLLENSVTPIQQYEYTSGKNSTDSAMIIDAMDILYSGNVEGFLIVSSDSDFTKLASRLRESGMMVVGMGEKKTPKPFIVACNIFRYLEVISAKVSENKTDNNKVEVNKADVATKTKQTTDNNMTNIEVVKEFIYKLLSEVDDDEQMMSSADIGNRLAKRFPDFDTRNYGDKKLTKFLSRFEFLQEVPLGKKGIYFTLKSSPFVPLSEYNR